jgi:flavin-dependent dehydrogenase
MESWDFLKGLGLDLEALNVSMITQLQVSAENGKLLEQKLGLGGFGISRYLLDYELVKIARAAGAIVEEGTKVNDVTFNKTEFTVDTSQNNYKTKIVCGSYGKRSNIDIKWKRPFATASRNKLNNYIGVKYHIRTDFPVDTIALHNFKNGYCGISKIEGDNYCLCYLTTADNLKRSQGIIPVMEQTILSKNPFLKKLLSESEILFEAPVTISQISFDKKMQVENNVLMIGDAAGMITPLCGNGMSMALNGSKLAAGVIHSFLKGEVSRDEMELQYTKLWQQHFAKRLKAGRMIQRLFGRSWVTNFFIGTIKHFPGVVKFLIRQTHGKPF